MGPHLTQEQLRSFGAFMVRANMVPISRFVQKLTLMTLEQDDNTPYELLRVQIVGFICSCIVQSTSAYVLE